MFISCTASFQEVKMTNIDLDSLKSMKVAELRDIAAKIGVENPEAIHKVQLRQVIADKVRENAASHDENSNEPSHSRDENSGSASSDSKTDFNARKKEHYENRSIETSFFSCATGKSPAFICSSASFTQSGISPGINVCSSAIRSSSI